MRREFLSSATELMNGFRSLDQQLSSLGREVGLNLDDSVKQVNQYVKDIASLNAEILQARAMGISDNSLLDQRDQITSRLSSYLEVENTTTSDGHEITQIAGGKVAIGSRPITFAVIRDAQGTIGISVGNLQSIIPLNSGSFAAMTTAMNDTIPQFQIRLRDLARGIVQTVDQQHAQGISDQGPATVLQGNRGVSSASLPLARSKPEFPINYGNLSVSVTDTATGVRQTQIITINPAVDSLDDVAAKLSTIPGVVASVDSSTNTLTIAGQGTYAIDFSGRSDDPLDHRLNPRPDETGILAALGIGSLFQGSEPGNFKVRDAIFQNPEQFVVSATGLPGDGRNAAAMASLRDVRFGPLSGRTFTEEMADVTAESGLQVRTSDTQNTQLQSFRQRLEIDQASISGVDVNEEMLKMMETQRGYQATAKLITTADQMLTELFNIIR